MDSLYTGDRVNNKGMHGLQSHVAAITIGSVTTESLGKMQELKDLFFFLGFTIASVVVVWYLVQGIKAIGNFVVRRKAKKAREARNRGGESE